MVFSHRVALNGVELDEIDSRIIVQGIEEAAGKDQISAVSRFGGTGQRITNRHRDSLDVTVRFSIHAKSGDMATRNEIFEKVNAWAAAGGWLTINYKPDRRLRVIRAQAPAAGDQWKWTNVYSIVFRAYGVPFWQQDPPGRLTASGSSIARQLGVAGSAETVLEATFKNTSGAVCNTLTIQAGDSTMAFTALGLANNEMLIIDHTEDGLLRIRIQNGSNYRSAMSSRTPESSDDMYVSPGTVSVILTAQRTGSLTITCSGRYD